ncbi:MAG: molybdopterin molybdotransferase MoeA [Candidatus Lokiarchaeota archaeon]|nr:molybdopterin molybdotransferase MoeA [Candidatus Lokiarchaeota archaeon]
MNRLHQIGFSKLSSVEDSLKKIFSVIGLTSIIQINTKDALNHNVANNIKSIADVPYFDRSAMDGYAIKAEDTFGASINSPKYFKKIGKIEIDELSKITINSFETVKISTGAQIPDGANAVIKIEETEIKGNTIKIYNSIVPNANISKRGSDTKKGEIIIENGIQIKPEHIALLCSQGIQKINVRKKPNISIFSTGNELIDIENTREGRQIYDSNTPMISNLVRIYGGIVIEEKIIRDNKDLIKKELLDALNKSDIIIFSGGTSVGTRDYLPEIMNQIAKVLIHGVAMRPGAPILIATKNNKLIFCLPGTPVASYIGFLIFVGPSIKKKMNSNILDPREKCVAIINQDVPVSSMGYIHNLRVKLEFIKNSLVAIPIRLKGSSLISSLTNSDGIVEILPFQEGIKKGDNVIVKLHPK